MRRVFASLALLTCVGVGLVGCSRASTSTRPYVEPTEPAIASTTLDAGNFYFKPDDVSVPTGVNQFTMKNVQSGIHSFVIRGVSGFMLEVSGKDSVDTKNVDLKPGTYSFYCNIPGHEQAGMKGKLTVTG